MIPSFYADMTFTIFIVECLMLSIVYWLFERHGWKFWEVLVLIIAVGTYAILFAFEHS